MESNFNNDIVVEKDKTMNDVELSTENQPTEKPIAVYVKVNENGFITEINSEIFIDNFDGWKKIDEGFGDRFAHAQSQYFDTPLVNEEGKYLHRLNEEA